MGGEGVEGAMDAGVEGEGVWDGSVEEEGFGVGSDLKHTTGNRPVTSPLICNYLHASPNSVAPYVFYKLLLKHHR